MTIECPHDVPFGMPSPEALQLATEDIRRRYVLPETMQHPQVRSECACACSVHDPGVRVSDVPLIALWNGGWAAYGTSILATENWGVFRRETDDETKRHTFA